MIPYDWLYENLENFCDRAGVPNAIASGQVLGLILAHADKTRQYYEQWEKADIPIPHGVALYLLARIPPYSQEVRDTSKGFVSPSQWVIDNYNRFKGFF